MLQDALELVKGLAQVAHGRVGDDVWLCLAQNLVHITADDDANLLLTQYLTQVLAYDCWVDVNGPDDLDSLLC